MRPRTPRVGYHRRLTEIRRLPFGGSGTRLFPLSLRRWLSTPETCKGMVGRGGGDGEGADGSGSGLFANRPYGSGRPQGAPLREALCLTGVTDREGDGLR